MSVKLSERMLLDGMYPGIVEKWAAEVAGLEQRLEAAEKRVEQLEQNLMPAGDTISDGFGNTWAATCECGGKMSVVRPGVVQCSECG